MINGGTPFFDAGVFRQSMARKKKFIVNSHVSSTLMKFGDDLIGLHVYWIESHPKSSSGCTKFQ